MERELILMVEEGEMEAGADLQEEVEQEAILVMEVAVRVPDQEEEDVVVL